MLVPAALLVFGAGMGAAAVCGQIAALTGVGQEDSGLAAGLADTSFSVGTALGVAVCTGVAAHPSAGPAPVTLIAGHRAAFETAAVFAALGLVTVVTLLRRRSGRARAELRCDATRP